MKYPIETSFVTVLHLASSVMIHQCFLHVRLWTLALSIELNSGMQVFLRCCVLEHLVILVDVLAFAILALSGFFDDCDCHGKAVGVRHIVGRRRGTCACFWCVFSRDFVRVSL